jgi:VCBS repeat-containing protein
VTFTITGTNDAPTIRAEAAEAITEVPGDSSAQALSDSGVITFGDLDTTDVVDITFASNNDIAWSGGTLTDAQTSALIGGFSIPATAHADAPGSVDWAYSLNEVDLDFLAAGETLSFSYTVTATDSQGAAATDTVTFTITGTNDAPTISAESAAPITEVDDDSSAQTLSDNGVVTFGDLDTTDLVDITFASNNDIAWSGATASEPLNADLAAALVNGFSIPATTEAAAPGHVDWAYSLNDVDLDFLATGETLSFSYTVTATDSQGASATDTVTFTITGTNDAPTIRAEAAEAITEAPGDSSAQALSDSGAITFGDLDTTDLVDITFASNNDIAWSGATASEPLNADLAASLVNGFSIPATTEAAAPGGVDWSYSLNDVDLDFLAAGETLSFSYTVTATDGEGAMASDIVTFSITGTNDSPVFTGGKIAGEVIDGEVLSDSGSLTFADGDFNARPEAKEVTGSITASRADGTSLSLTADQKQAIENAFSIHAADSNTNNGTIYWDYTIDAAEVEFLAEGEVVSAIFTVTVSDVEGASGVETVNVTLVGKNDAPTIRIDGSESFTEEAAADQQSLSQKGKINFSDVDLTDTTAVEYVSNGDLEWKRSDGSQVDGVPSGLAEALIEGFKTGGAELPNVGQIDWEFNVSDADLDFLNAGDTLSFSYTVTVEDSQGASASEIVTIVVDGTNDGPQTSRSFTSEDTTVQKGADYHLAVDSLFSDKDSTFSRESLTYRVEGLPKGLSFESLTNLIVGKPAESGAFTVTLTAMDSEGVSVSRTYELIVTAVVGSDTPVAPSETTSPTAPETAYQPVDAGGSEQGAGSSGGVIARFESGDPADTSGFVSSSGEPDLPGAEDFPAEPEESPVETAGSPGEPAGERVLIAEQGALVVQSENSSGVSTTRASIDVNVGEDGQVVFTEIQEEAFSTVGLRVVSIGRVSDNSIAIEIEDSGSRSGVTEFNGSLSDGQRLPSWIQVDPYTGAVVIENVPAGRSKIDIRIQAIGGDGQVRILDLNLDLDELLKRKPTVEAPTPESLEDSTGYLPLSEQLEAELAGKYQYGSQLVAMLEAS